MKTQKNKQPNSKSFSSPFFNNSNETSSFLSRKEEAFFSQNKQESESSKDQDLPSDASISLANINTSTILNGVYLNLTDLTKIDNLEKLEADIEDALRGGRSVVYAEKKRNWNDNQ